MTSETFLNGRVTIKLGDVREQLRLLPADSFDCVVTSPPYKEAQDEIVAALSAPSAAVTDEMVVYKAAHESIAAWTNTEGGYGAAQRIAACALARHDQNSGGARS